MRSIRLAAPVLGFLALLTTTATGQGLPTEQPNYLSIFREQVKAGHAADHRATEAGWPAALAKAGVKESYLALASMTGSPEVLFVQPRASFAAAAEAMQRNDADPVLSAELARLEKADGDHLSGFTSLLLAARKDLSHGAYPDIATQRFFEITTFRMKAGKESSFEAAGKAYTEMVQRGGSGATWRVYEVIAGAQGPTYMIFSSHPSYADFDTGMVDGNKAWSTRTEGEKAIFARFSEDLVFSMTNYYSVDPAMSFVPAEVRARDPGFWSPAPAAKKKK